MEEGLKMNPMESGKLPDRMESKILSCFSFLTAVFASPFALIFAQFFFARVKDRCGERASASTLIETIFGIMRARSVPEVLRVYASGIITAVANFSSWRNRAFKFFENKPMCQSLLLSAIFSPNDLPVGEVCARIIRLPCVVPASGFEIDFYSEEDPLPWLK